MGYFLGWKDRKDCSKAYLEDFGMLGSFEEFKK